MPCFARSVCVKISGMKKSLIPLLLTVFIDSLGFGLIFPLLSPLVMQPDSPMLLEASLSTRGWVFGFVISIFCIGQFLGGPIAGALSDRFGRKSVICSTLLIGAVSYLVAGLSICLSSVLLFMISRLFVGLTSGNFAVVQSIVADLSSEKEKRKYFGLVGMAWGVGFILGPYLGGRIAGLSGITMLFFYSAFLCFVNFLLSKWFIEETLIEPHKTPWTLLGGVRNIKKALTHPILRGVFVVTFLYSLGWGFFTEFASIFLMDRFHFGPQEIGNFYAYAGIWVAVCRGVLIQPFVSRYSPEKLMRIALVFLSMNLLIFLGSESTWIVFLAVPFIVFPESLIYPNAAAIVSSLSAKDERGEMLGIHSSIQWASMGILPLFSGALVANYPLMPILVSSALTFGALLAFSYYFRVQLSRAT